MTLAQNSCRSRCDWRPTSRELEGEPVFECSGCTSEWVPSEPWTPMNADGTIRPEVEAARQRRP
ncbi:hypothetical protein [Arachnia propionica]|uniref:Uncharacterized protein n=1 Tax=Arachnia propionica TaxID=1750 RepID=A0A3P1WQP4_9ACTN|nr:hypothetical protein [Arachnia propionica]RRD48605.1 hypothetical protein EII35_12135 [Arachnia propionica]